MKKKNEMAYLKLLATSKAINFLAVALYILALIGLATDSVWFFGLIMAVALIAFFVSIVIDVLFIVKVLKHNE